MKNLTIKVFVSVLTSMMLFVGSYQTSYGYDNSNAVVSGLNENDKVLLEKFAELASEVADCIYTYWMK